MAKELFFALIESDATDKCFSIMYKTNVKENVGISEFKTWLERL